jgi:AMP nucleosidase
MSKSEHFRRSRCYLERYTGSSLEKFHSLILLTNFTQSFRLFCERYPSHVTQGSVMSAAHAKRLPVSLINFNLGSPTAALLIDILSCVDPFAILMLGWCGALDRNLEIGDWILPTAAIRDEGVSSHYLPVGVPALPSFKIQKSLSNILTQKGENYKTGIIHSTDYRFWELDRPFIDSLKQEKAIAIEMECSGLFVAGLKRDLAVGALLLVSDLPLRRKQMKTKMIQEQLFRKWGARHLEVGVETLLDLKKETRRIHQHHFKW